MTRADLDNALTSFTHDAIADFEREHSVRYLGDCGVGEFGRVLTLAGVRARELFRSDDDVPWIDLALWRESSAAELVAITLGPDFAEMVGDQAAAEIGLAADITVCTLARGLHCGLMVPVPALVERMDMEGLTWQWAPGAVWARTWDSNPAWNDAANESAASALAGALA